MRGTDILEAERENCEEAEKEMQWWSLSVTPPSPKKNISAHLIISYFGILGDKFDLKLIPEFDGSTSILDRVEKVELHCYLTWIALNPWFIYACPRGFSQCINSLIPRKNLIMRGSRQHYTRCLLSTPATAWEARTLCPGETVDVYLAELTKLTVLFSGLPEWALACIFLAGLPKVQNSCELSFWFLKSTSRRTISSAVIRAKSQRK